MSMYSGILHRLLGYLVEDTSDMKLLVNEDFKYNKKKERKNTLYDKLNLFDLYFTKIILLAWILIMPIYFM